VEVLDVLLVVRPTDADIGGIVRDSGTQVCHPPEGAAAE